MTPPSRNLMEQESLHQRSNYISFASLTNNVTTNFNLVTINDSNVSSSSKIPLSKETVTLKEEASRISGVVSGLDSNNSEPSNTYLLRSNNFINNFCNNNNGTSLNNHHQRHMSVPVGGNVTPLKSLPTSSSTFQTSITPKNANLLPLENASPSTSSSVHVPPTNLKLYENVKIKSLNNINNNHNNSNNVNVSYENINLEYINQLMKEGYSKESVISALCISRNNFEMACDILHEFVSTNQQQKVCSEK